MISGGFYLNIVLTFLNLLQLLLNSSGNSLVDGRIALAVLFLVFLTISIGGFAYAIGDTPSVLALSFVSVVILVALFFVRTMQVKFENKIFFYLAYVLLPLVYSVIYWCYSQIDECIYISGRSLDFFDHVYFSIITLTGLGYADVYPIGICKFVAASEAFMGYAFLPVIVSLAVADILEKRL